jgi:hypothetical protein
MSGDGPSASAARCPAPLSHAGDGVVFSSREMTRDISSRDAAVVCLSSSLKFGAGDDRLGPWPAIGADVCDGNELVFCTRASTPPCSLSGDRSAHIFWGCFLSGRGRTETLQVLTFPPFFEKHFFTQEKIDKSARFSILSRGFSLTPHTPHTHTRTPSCSLVSSYPRASLPLRPR